MRERGGATTFKLVHYMKNCLQFWLGAELQKEQTCLGSRDREGGGKGGQGEGGMFPSILVLVVAVLGYISSKKRVNNNSLVFLISKQRQNTTFPFGFAGSVRSLVFEIVWPWPPALKLGTHTEFQYI